MEKLNRLKTHTGSPKKDWIPGTLAPDELIVEKRQRLNRQDPMEGTINLENAENVTEKSALLADDSSEQPLARPSKGQTPRLLWADLLVNLACSQ